MRNLCKPDVNEQKEKWYRVKGIRGYHDFNFHYDSFP